MEPVFMILGESAAIAASLACSHHVSTHDLPYPLLRTELEKAGQILETQAANAEGVNP